MNEVLVIRLALPRWTDRPVMTIAVDWDVHMRCPYDYTRGIWKVLSTVFYLSNRFTKPIMFGIILKSYLSSMLWHKGVLAIRRIFSLVDMITKPKF